MTDFTPLLTAAIDREAVVIFIICSVFLILFAVAGVRDVLRRRDEE
ncbi:MAG: hypothetical protein S4CHLAM45_05060 [Chlamydiales bacterium]|nr:hypothetical protein [Chlamydiales bacterium]MCH9619953.1 hypothetical protein [Chlamydiales bacterium]MCH9622620.1 hypothetical protein [Chlamydiales bacterium]